MKDSKREALEAAVKKASDAWYKAADAWLKAKKELEEYNDEGQ